MRRFETSAAMLGGLLLLCVALSSGAYHRHGRAGYAAAAQGEGGDEDEDLYDGDGSYENSNDAPAEQGVFWDEGDSANDVAEDEEKEDAAALEERQGFYNVPYYWYWR